MRELTSKWLSFPSFAEGLDKKCWRDCIKNVGSSIIEEKSLLFSCWAVSSIRFYFEIVHAKIISRVFLDARFISVILIIRGSFAVIWCDNLPQGEMYCAMCMLIDKCSHSYQKSLRDLDVFPCFPQRCRSMKLQAN